MTTRVSEASAALARRQARWIVALEPWRSLGYETTALSRWLAKQADSGHVRVVRSGSGRSPEGIVVFQRDVLLGWFVPLLAVRPESAGRGLGRALLAEVARLAFASRRWLYVSCDAENGSALRFYRKLRFSRVGRLPDMVRAGREEWLLRVGKDEWRDVPQGPEARGPKRARPTAPRPGRFRLPLQGSALK